MMYCAIISGVLLAHLTLSSAWIVPDERIVQPNKCVRESKASNGNNGFSGFSGVPRRRVGEDDVEDFLVGPLIPRRQMLDNAVQMGSILAAPWLLGPDEVVAATTERCDVGNPRCGSDGILRDSAPTGKPIPRVTNKITHVVQLIIEIGERGFEVGPIRFGLYGEDCPGSVQQMLQFLTRGISSMSQETLQNSIGMMYAPVSILEGGSVPTVCPGKAVDFGVASQAKAYAQSRGLRTVPEFVPQQRPQQTLENEARPRKHDVAGLVSIPAKGIGYATSSSGSDDEAYASAFSITVDEALELDKLNRRVIGQIIDDESMTFLARLASLPVQKGIKGVVPGKSSGPPLLKVTIRDAGVQKVPNKK